MFISGTFFASASTSSTSIPSSSSYDKTIKVTASDIAKYSNDAYTPIKNALIKARDYAKDSNYKKYYKVVVDAGSYYLSKTLNIYSNTTLVLTDVTLKQTETKTNTTTGETEGNDSNMIKVGDSIDAETGYAYKNIYIKGGTLNENGNKHTCLKIAHAQNVTISGLTFKNVTNGHMMEVAGVNGLTISNCTYKNQQLTIDTSVEDHNALTYEAIQLDILKDTHFNGYVFEDLPNKNITITGCTFDTVPRGIGSHTAVLNNPIDGLTITNNTFKNISSCAIHLIGCKNVTISKNTIKDGPRGIAVYSYQLNGTFLATTLANDSIGKTDSDGNALPTTTTSTSTSYETPTDANIVISNNTITTSGTDPYSDYEKSGIFVSGLNLSTKDAAANTVDSIPAGKYYLTGVTISGNTIKSVGHGIRLSFVKKAVISSNKKIIFTGTNYSKSTDTMYYGISLTNNSSASSIDKNIVNPNSSSTRFYKDLYLLNSTVTKVSGNKFYKSINTAVSLEGSTVSTMSTNTITNAGYNGIHVYKKSTVKSLKSNTIKTTSYHGISIDESSTATTIKSNTVNSAKFNGIYVKSSTVNSIDSNTIRDTKDKYGIAIQGSTVNTVQNNVVARSKVNDIYISQSSTVTTLTGNTSKNATKYGISIEGAVAKTVSSNKITSSGNTGIRVSSSARVSNMKSNTIQSAKGYGIDVEDATCTNITSNTISKSSKNGINVSKNGKTKVKKIASNTITDGSAYGISIQSIRCDMTVSKNTIKNCSGAYMLYYNPRTKDYAATISSNKITGKSKSKGRGIYVATGDVSIKSNTVQKCQQALVLSKNAKGSIYGNTFKSNGNNKIVIG